MDQIVGIYAGVFDLLHVGHIAAIREAEKNCDYLIIALQTDPTIDRPNKSKPVQSIYERFTQLESVLTFGDIVPYDTEADLENMYKTSYFQVRFVGADYFGKLKTGDNIFKISSKCVKTIYLSRDHTYSTTELKKRVVENYSQWSM